MNPPDFAAISSDCQEAGDGPLAQENHLHRLHDLEIILIGVRRSLGLRHNGFLESSGSRMENSLLIAALLQSQNVVARGRFCRMTWPHPIKYCAPLGLAFTAKVP